MGNPKEAELEEQQAPSLPQYCDDSDTVMGDEKIYTPPSTASNSGESHPDLNEEVAVENARESDQLLPSSPPGYRDHVSSPEYQHGDVKVDIKDDCIIKEEDSPEEPTRRCRGLKRFRRWWRERRQCRRREIGEARERPCCVKIFIALKAALIVWLCLWLVRWATVSFIRRHHRHHHQHSVGYHNHGFGCHSISPREIIVREKETWIHGNYPLYDLLDLSTRSGSIYVTIDPQPAHPDDPTRPAKVSIRSRTGNVFVRFRMPNDDAVVSDALSTFVDAKSQPSLFKEVFLKDPALSHHPWQSNSSSIPPRPYEFNIETRNGNVFAVLGFSTHAAIKTQWGNINTHLTPLVFENTTFYKNTECKDCDDISITTHTRSGNVFLSVTEPSFIASEKPEHVPGDTASNAPNTKMRIDPRSPDTNIQKAWDRILKALNKTPDHSEVKACSHSELNVSAYHKSYNSGNMAISYPNSWAGRVLAMTSRRGNAVLRGKGLEVTGRSPDGRSALAAKKPTIGHDDKNSWWGSEGNMRVNLDALRGSVEFDVRD
ncbi:hypothetical protein MGYG_01019 [Nannizzia gypsea CBS 118893]|uniref:Uncharacterized protein n=1 Tax=Arthroderma gypseum (strain ATCC MYA-4604 / CBS 118893) TaxID=535722 RepID=E5R3S3_ARTGP|nr:hypothetical protein MGYG_01019 [Nannizzia gypsea CBS 118893]EFQ97983.1 hypothetical protein MGYG_01019 [Nannizzia gypsea CBS 118893]